MPEIFLHYIGHGHAQSGGKILRCHHLLLFWILQQLQQRIRQSLGVSRGIELHRQFLTLRHLPEISQICRNDGYSIGAGQVRYPAATRRR